MSNRRAILFFLFGSLALAVVLWMFSYRAAAVATVRTRSTLSGFDPAHVTRLEVKPVGSSSGPEVAIERSGDAWRIVSPFSAETDPAAVSRLLDAVTLSPVADMLSLDDLRSLGHSLADFGLAPARMSVEITAGTKRERLLLGGDTPSGSEIYARSEELRNVFTVSADVFRLVSAGPDSLRRLSLVAGAAADVVGLEFRIPDKPFVKLARENNVWRLLLPAPAPADAKTADALVERLVSSRVSHFVWPSAASGAVAADSKPRADLLASYGLDPASPTAFTATVRRAPDAADQIVFGKPAGTNLVYALVQNGGAVVAVDSSLADFCRVGEAGLRDTRLFPCAAADVSSVTITAPDAVIYRLVQDKDRVWRLDTPVNAPADPSAASWLVECVLRLRQADLAEKGVGVAVSTASTNMPAFSVATPELTKPGTFANLRAKTLLEIDPAAVRKISLRTASGVTAVEWDAERGAWNLMPSTDGDAPPKPPAGAVNEAAVKRLLTALARVDAGSVETLSATAGDFTRCGLDKPAFVVAVDLAGEKTVHREIVIGGAASGGGRFATVGGADAVFVVPRTTVSALTASLTE
jgi:hypothetical protein